MLRAAAEQVKKNHEMLSKLDSFGGDGDHGTTMLRAMTILETAIESSSKGDLKALLHGVGWGIMGVDGGATGPLLGTLLMGMSAVVAGEKSLDAGALAATFEAGLAAVQKRTKARPGDKTLLDALVRRCSDAKVADGGADVLDVLAQAADAAEKGAAATKDMQAKFGRAKNIGAKSVGNQDPGATSVSLIFEDSWKE
jgi:dihydroxyacetone kinase-like protein